MLSLRNLLRRKVRTVLTVVGVALGVAVVVALSAATRGLKYQLDGMFAAGDAHLVLTRKGAADPFISYLPDDLLPRLRAAAGVAAVFPAIFGVIQLPTYPFFFAFGVTAGSPFLGSVRVEEGKGLFDDGGPDRRILLGRQAARHLDLGVGSTIRLGHGEYSVVGTFESAIPFISAGGILPFADAQLETGLEDKMTSAMVQMADFDPTGLDAFEAELEAAFPIVEATPPGRFTGAFDEFAVLDEAVFVFSLLAVVIGGIGVMNTMLMSVFERTREIGVLQAIGWSKAMVLRQVLGEAALVCLVGAPLGIAAGAGGLEAVARIGEYAWLAGDYGPGLIAAALAIGVGMGVVGAAYPAWRAIRVTPIAALRYE